MALLLIIIAPNGHILANIAIVSQLSLAIDLSSKGLPGQLHPVEGGGKAEDAHEGSGGFLVAGCDGAPFLEARPQALDAVAIVVDPARAGDGRLVALGRDRRPGALVPDELAERVRGIAFVADNPARNIGQAIDQILGQGKFMSLTGRQGEADRPADAVGDHASLGAIAAARAAKRLTHVALGSRSPFLGAPAALWCALIEVPSRKAMPSSTPRSWTRSRSRSQTPRWLQRMKVCAARHQGTRSGGTLRHFAPFRSRQTIASIVSRSATGSVLPRGRHSSISGPSTAHCSSLRTISLL